MPLTDIDGQRLGDSVADKLGNRNLIINGAMQVAQRSTSETGVTGDGYHTVDRARIDLNGLGTHTVSQSTDAPEGFSNSFKVECTTAQASPATGAYFVYMQRIEGQNLQMLKKGTSNAEQVTVSFYVKSDKTGDYTLGLNDRDNTRNNSKRYTISSVDTWEYKTLTFEADTTGTLDNDAAESLRLDFWLASGTDFNSGTLQTGWESTVNANRAVGNVNLSDTVGNNWSITGLQLEVGNTATPFEHRSYGDELARCQRYYYEVTSSTANKNMNQQGVLLAASATAYEYLPIPPVPMRAAPSCTLTDDVACMRLDGGSSLIEVNLNGTDLLVLPNGNGFSGHIYGSRKSGTGFTIGNTGRLCTGSTAGKLAFSAEL